MKSAIRVFLAGISIFLLVSMSSCRQQPTAAGERSEPIQFYTERNSYTQADSIRLHIRNGSNGDLVVGRRCDLYLEMFYQKKDNQSWGDSLWPAFMSFRCTTVLDTILLNSTFSNSIPVEMFAAPGNFRLLTSVYIIQSDTSLSVISNSFEIK
jgi:hypothetical protein